MHVKSVLIMIFSILPCALLLYCNFFLFIYTPARRYLHVFVNSSEGDFVFSTLIHMYICLWFLIVRSLCGNKSFARSIEECVMMTISGFVTIYM